MVTRFAGVVAVLLLLAAPSHQSAQCDNIKKDCSDKLNLVPADRKASTCESAQQTVKDCVTQGKVTCAGEAAIVQALDSTLTNITNSPCLSPCVSCTETKPALQVVLQSKQINKLLVCMKTNCTLDESKITYQTVKEANDFFIQGFSANPQYEQFEACSEAGECLVGKLDNVQQISDDLSTYPVLQNNLTHLPFLCKYIETLAYCFVNQSDRCIFEDAFVKILTAQYQKIHQKCTETAGNGNGAAHIVPSVLYLVAIILAMMS